MKLDPSYTPIDKELPEDNGEKTLAWVKNSFTCEQVYGDDVFEKPSLDFCKWVILNRWHFICDQWWHPYQSFPINDEQLYQEYLKENQ